MMKTLGILALVVITVLMSVGLSAAIGVEGPRGEPGIQGERGKVGKTGNVEDDEEIMEMLVKVYENSLDEYGCTTELLLAILDLDAGEVLDYDALGEECTGDD